MPIDKIARFGELVKRFLLAPAYKSFLELINVCQIFIYQYYQPGGLFFCRGAGRCLTQNHCCTLSPYPAAAQADSRQQTSTSSY